MIVCRRCATVMTVVSLLNSVWIVRWMRASVSWSKSLWDVVRWMKWRTTDQWKQSLKDWSTVNDPRISDIEYSSPSSNIRILLLRTSARARARICLIIGYMKSIISRSEDNVYLWPSEKLAPPASTWVSSVTLELVALSLEVTDTASPDTEWLAGSVVDAAEEVDKA